MASLQTASVTGTISGVVSRVFGFSGTVVTVRLFGARGIGIGTGRTIREATEECRFETQ